MDVHATTRIMLIATLLFCLGGCKPQFGSVTVTNGTAKTITEVNVRLPDLNNDFNSAAGVAVVRGTLAPGQAATGHTKGLPAGRLVVSWTEPDGSVVNVEQTLGDKRSDNVKIVIQDDGAIQVVRGKGR